MVIVVPVLAIVMIFMFRQVLSKAPRQTQGAAQEAAPLVAANPSNNEIDWQIPEPLPATMRDPIKPPDPNDRGGDVQNGTATPTETTAIDVRDIVFSKDKPSAVINGQIVYVGHKVGDAAIVQIYKDGVEFERNGKRWVEKIRD
jgi:hypothetical protein